MRSENNMASIGDERTRGGSGAAAHPSSRAPLEVRALDLQDGAGPQGDRPAGVVGAHEVGEAQAAQRHGRARASDVEPVQHLRRGERGGGGG